MWRHCCVAANKGGRSFCSWWLVHGHLESEPGPKVTLLNMYIFLKLNSTGCSFLLLHISSSSSSSSPLVISAAGENHQAAYGHVVQQADVCGAGCGGVRLMLLQKSGVCTLRPPRRCSRTCVHRQRDGLVFLQTANIEHDLRVFTYSRYADEENNPFALYIHMGVCASIYDYMYLS